MIIKIDVATETRLKQLQKEVQEKTGIKPQSISLMVQVLLQWSLDAVKGSTLNELAPSMLTISQQRKAVIGEMVAFKEKLNPAQIKQMMKTIEKLKQKASKVDTSLSDNSA
jgi:hypothetical protein